MTATLLEDLRARWLEQARAAGREAEAQGLASVELDAPEPAPLEALHAEPDPEITSPWRAA